VAMRSAHVCIESSCGRTTAHVAGRRLEVFVRAATTDIVLVDMILQDYSEYFLPQCVAPKIIFDIGANIGIASAYYAAIYTDAQVYCFDPLPENIELLRKNVQPFGPRVKVLEYGLSDTTGSLTYHMYDNPHSFGGGSLCKLGHDPDRQQTLAVQTVEQTLDELAISHVDVFKVDTEGSELAIVRGTPPSIRRSA